MYIQQNLTAIAFIGLICTVLFSCGQADPKNNAAFERAKAEKFLSNDSVSISKAMAASSVPTAAPKRIENVDDATRYYAEIEHKLLSNQNALNTLKIESYLNKKSFKKITKLGAAQDQIKQEIEQYKADSKLRWDQFKTQTDHDIKEINLALKVLSAKN